VNAGASQSSQQEKSMAGSSIVTDMDRETAVRLVGTVARDEGFSVERVEDDELKVGQGNLIASIFLGAFIAYCDFKVVFHPEPGNRVEIEMNRNNPWWTGIIGIGRVKNIFKKLVDAIEEEIEAAGGRIINSEDF
jgi:hypothetical protein